MNLLAALWPFQTPSMLLKERNVAIQERNEAKRDLAQQLSWSVVQAENVMDGMRQIDALRSAVVGLLWNAVADQEGCGCDDGWPGPTPLCRAWQALGYEGHFDWQTAADLLPHTADSTPGHPAPEGDGGNKPTKAGGRDSEQAPSAGPGAPELAGAPSSPASPGAGERPASSDWPERGE
jgi:hypothetical protein